MHTINPSFAYASDAPIFFLNDGKLFKFSDGYTVQRTDQNQVILI